MVDRELFLRYVRDALGHLDDQLYLDAHPLARLLAGPMGASQPGAMHRALLDAIQQLRPADVASDSTESRRYRYLWLRYVQGKSPGDIARELSVSPRQTQRDHLEALEAVGSVLWARYGDRLRAMSGTATLHTAERPADSLPEGSEAELDAELWRMGTAVANDTPAAVGPILREAVAAVLGLARTGQVRLEVSAPPGLAPVAVNAAALRHVVLSLLSHAIERSQDGLVVVSMAETPHGINLDVEFAPGAQRVPEADDPFWVIRRLLGMRGGGVDVLSRAGGRSAVRLGLPRAEVATVLVIDDNPDAIRLFQRYLEGSAFRVLHASTGQRALQLAREARPDIITLDLVMPSQDGLEVLQMLKADPCTQSVPVLVCTVFRERALALSLGAAAFLTKPVTPETLLAALRQHCPPLDDRARPGSPSGIAHTP